MGKSMLSANCVGNNLVSHKLSFLRGIKLERIKKLRHEEAETRKNMKTNKKTRVEAAKKLKELWSRRKA